MKAIWQLRRLRENGVQAGHIKKAFECYGRPKVEFGVPAIFRCLNDGQKASLQTTQSAATKCMLGSAHRPCVDGYIPPYTRDKELGLQPCLQRLLLQTCKFEASLEFHPAFKKYLETAPLPPYGFRTKRKYYLHLPFNTERARYAPVTQAIWLLNCLPGTPVQRKLLLQR